MPIYKRVFRKKRHSYIHTSNILIETGDLIQRKMSNGATETYEVIDPGYHEGGSHIPAGYQIKHKNLGLPEVKEAIKNITYNISGHNSRVNNQSVDQSINTVNGNSEVNKQLELLREEINSINSSELEKKNYLETVDAIESQFNTDRPSKAVINTLISSLPNIASISSIGSFLLAAIS